MSEPPKDNEPASSPARDDGVAATNDAPVTDTASADGTDAGPRVPWERPDRRGLWRRYFATLRWAVGTAASGRGEGPMLDATHSLPAARRFRRYSFMLALLAVAISIAVTDHVMLGRTSRMPGADYRPLVIAFGLLAAFVVTALYYALAASAVGWFFCSRRFDDAGQDRALAVGCYLSGVALLLWATPAALTPLVLSASETRRWLPLAASPTAMLVLSALLVAGGAHRVFGRPRRTALTAVGIAAAWIGIGVLLALVPAAVGLWLVIVSSLS